MKQEMYEGLFEFFEECKDNKQKIKIYLKEKKEGSGQNKFLMLAGIPSTWDEFSVTLKNKFCIIPLDNILNVKYFDE